MPNAQLARILRDARHLIAIPEKWSQGAPEKGSGQHCMVTAVGFAAVDYPPMAFRDSLDVLRDAVGSRSQVVSSWNDDPKRTHEEVLAAFDRAIAAAESIGA